MIKECWMSYCKTLLNTLLYVLASPLILILIVLNTFSTFCEIVFGVALNAAMSVESAIEDFFRRHDD